MSKISDGQFREPCKLLNGVIPALVAMFNIAARYRHFRDGQV